MRVDAGSWIGSLPPALARHADVIRRLLTETTTDARLRILVVGCSIGRGVADELSDIDAYVAVAPADWLRYLDETSAMLGRLGDLMDEFHTRVTPDGKDPYQSSWALYGDGVLLELVIASAPKEVRPRRDWVVLHDPDGRVTAQQPDHFASPEEVRQWGYEAWSTLLLCDKYVRRQSLWEALETLQYSRTRLWRIWAAARRIPDPQFGLTAVLDSDRPSAPPGIGTTHSTLDARGLARAALACAELLEALWPDATAAASGAAEPLPKVASVLRRRMTDLVADG